VTHWNIQYLGLPLLLLGMGIILKPGAGSAWGVAGQSAYGVILILSLMSLTP
jgi:hypothetical protein